MFGFGMPQMTIILAMVVLIFGVGRLPEVGGALGKGIRNFKKAAEGKDGVRREASLMLLGGEVEEGDFVIVHAGFAISKLDEEDALETLRLLREVFSAEDASWITWTLSATGGRLSAWPGV